MRSLLYSDRFIFLWLSAL